MKAMILVVLLSLMKGTSSWRFELFLQKFFPRCSEKQKRYFENPPMKQINCGYVLNRILFQNCGWLSHGEWEESMMTCHVDLKNRVSFFAESNGKPFWCTYPSKGETLAKLEIKMEDSVFFENVNNPCLQFWSRAFNKGSNGEKYSLFEISWDMFNPFYQPSGFENHGNVGLKWDIQQADQTETKVNMFYFNKGENGRDYLANAINEVALKVGFDFYSNEPNERELSRSKIRMRKQKEMDKLIFNMAKINLKDIPELRSKSNYQIRKVNMNSQTGNKNTLSSEFIVKIPNNFEEQPDEKCGKKDADNPSNENDVQSVLPLEDVNLFDEEAVVDHLVSDPSDPSI